MSDDPIIDILRKYEYKHISRSGDNLSASCLWHIDKSPSFSINSKSGAWQCFSCKSAGPHLVSLVARLEHCSDKEARRKLFGGEDSDKHYERIVNWAKTLTTEKKPPAERPVPKIPSDLSLVPWRRSEDARSWLGRIRISDETADFFGLMWCGFGYYSGHMAVPILAPDKSLLTYEFRRVIGHGINGKKVIYPLHSPLGTMVYNLPKLAGTVRRVILVEGCKDVWSLHQAGGHAISCFGTHVSPRQIQAMLAQGIDEIALLFDGDKAGIEAAKKVSVKLANWFTIDQYQCPPGLDPNDCRAEFLRGLVKTIFRVELHKS